MRYKPIAGLAGAGVNVSFDGVGFKAYNEGIAAFLAGRSKSACTYRPGSAPWKDWCDGWDDGKLFASSDAVEDADDLRAAGALIAM